MRNDLRAFDMKEKKWFHENIDQKVMTAFLKNKFTQMMTKGKKGIVGGITHKNLYINKRFSFV